MADPMAGAEPYYRITTEPGMESAAENYEGLGQVSYDSGAA